MFITLNIPPVEPDKIEQEFRYGIYCKDDDKYIALFSIFAHAQQYLKLISNSSYHNHKIVEI